MRHVSVTTAATSVAVLAIALAGFPTTVAADTAATAPAACESRVATPTTSRAQCQPPTAPATTTPPSASFDPASLTALATVQERWTSTQSDRVLIRTRNEHLNAILGDRVERELERLTLELGIAPPPGQIEIVVHPTRQAYLAATGRTDKHVTASVETTEQSAPGATRVRRVIHLVQLTEKGRFDTELLDRTLPHELCHLLLAAWFGDRAGPLYLLEGLAIAAEYGRHDGRLLRAGLNVGRNTAMPLEKLWALGVYPAKQADAFYAQSYSVTTYLRSQMTTKQFRRFCAELKGGHTTAEALRRTLRVGREGRFIERLQQAWRDDTIRQATLVAATDADTGSDRPAPAGRRDSN